MIEFTDKLCVVIPVDDPSPIAYLNLYEQGDIWIKTQSCEKCSDENRYMCCGKCPMNIKLGCVLHMDSGYINLNLLIV